MPIKVNRRLLLLLALLAIDVAFMGMHVARKLTPLFQDPRFALSQDQGFAEQFEYLQYALIIGALIYLGRQSFSWVYAVWAGVFGYLLTDDALQIHETVGHELAERFHFVTTAGLHPDDIGGLAVAAVLGSTFFVAIAAAHFVSSAPLRRVNLHFLALLVALAFFGVVADALHELAGNISQMFKGAVGVVEDGGEMLVMSVAAYFVLGLSAQGATPAVASSPLR